MVSADYWLADYPELRRTTQPSTIGGPLREPVFCIFCSTENAYSIISQIWDDADNFAGIILCMRPANERQHYNVMSALIGWANT